MISNFLNSFFKTTFLVFDEIWNSFFAEISTIISFDSTASFKIVFNTELFNESVLSTPEKRTHVIQIYRVAGVFYGNFLTDYNFPPIFKRFHHSREKNHDLLCLCPQGKKLKEFFNAMRRCPIVLKIFDSNDWKKRYRKWFELIIAIMAICESAELKNFIARTRRL